MQWNSEYVSELVQRALAEDVGSGDANRTGDDSGFGEGPARTSLRGRTSFARDCPWRKCVFRALDPENAD